MAVIIKRVRDVLYDWEEAGYIVRVNDGPDLATFTHRPRDGLAECLRSAADALDAAPSPSTQGE